MGTTSKIEWTDRTWNPTTGCSHVSAGCEHCYAEAISHRFKRTVDPWVAARAHVNVKTHPERLAIPFEWPAGDRVFVDSMSDLFHAEIPIQFVAAVWAVMALTPGITYQILTKRPERFRTVLQDPRFYELVIQAAEHWRGPRPNLHGIAIANPWTSPLANVWLGVSVEDERVEDRISILLDTPAAVRFLSCEPLIGPLELIDYLKCDHQSFDGIGVDVSEHGSRDRWRCMGCRAEGHMRTAADGWEYFDVAREGRTIDWVIVGGESGPGARRMRMLWLERIVRDCESAGVPVFVKQLGSALSKEFRLRSSKGGDVDEWPEPFRPLGIREFPNGGERG